jgi:hypothetical protein
MPPILRHTKFISKQPMTCNSPYSLTESFYDCVSEWCCENEVQYEDETVSSFAKSVTEENFETMLNRCGEALRTLNYNPSL